MIIDKPSLFISLYLNRMNDKHVFLEYEKRFCLVLDFKIKPNV